MVNFHIVHYVACTLGLATEITFRLPLKLEVRCWVFPRFPRDYDSGRIICATREAAVDLSLCYQYEIAVIVNLSPKENL